MKYPGTALLSLFGFLLVSGVADAAASDVPEPFRAYDENSTYAINYDDLTALLKAVVVDVGRSNRRVPEAPEDVTGTRLKAKVTMTANEGNRFYFETFDDDETRQLLLDIQSSLEKLPGDAPLKYFSREEQLAYWLNLYNVTVLNQIIAEYPKINLKKEIGGKSSFFTEKLLTVAGVPLSLNDIQYKILKENYDSDPLVLYGLYQGIIGGPNIRKSAYTGANVYAALRDNAVEFINSNRGTFSKFPGQFRVSSFYERNEDFFPNFETDLVEHISTYLEGSLVAKLEEADKIKTNIDDWTITDLGGSQRRIGGSFATSRAALLDSVESTTPADGGGFMNASIGAGNSYMAEKGQHLSRIQPELLVVLQDINEKRQSENMRNATVGIEDIEDSQEEPARDTDEDQ